MSWYKLELLLLDDVANDDEGDIADCLCESMEVGGLLPLVVAIKL